MKSLLLALSLILLSTNFAQAYCRNNNTKCKEVTLREQEARLEKKLSHIGTEGKKAEIQEEIEAIQYQAKRLEDKSKSLASSTTGH